MIFNNPKCEKCANNHLQRCLLFDKVMEDDFFCYYYTESPYVCEICKKHLPTDKVVYETGGNQTSYHLICANCSSMIGTCSFCKNANTCKFEQDKTISEPLYVIQEIRQGPMITQQQVKNPKRIEKTCINCSCYKSGDCLKANNSSCEDYKCIVENW